jgi:hypothetical protein
LKASVLAVLGIMAVAGASPADAQVRFSGSALGCFGLDCSPVNSSETGFLNFTGMSFDETTRNDGRAQLMFGYFSWDAFIGETYIDSPFTLFLAFTNPTGIYPDPVYYGNAEGVYIRGKLNGAWTATSDLQLTFEPNQREYTFTGGDPDRPGEFTLTLNNMNINPDNRHIIGTVTDATVTPEPVSLILMGSGLAGLAAARRRRKRPSSDV